MKGKLDLQSEKMPLEHVLKGCGRPSHHMPPTDVRLLAGDLSSGGILREIPVLHSLLINCSRTSSLVGRKVIHWESVTRRVQQGLLSLLQGKRWSFTSWSISRRGGVVHHQCLKNHEGMVARSFPAVAVGSSGFLASLITSDDRVTTAQQPWNLRTDERRAEGKQQ